MLTVTDLGVDFGTRVLFQDMTFSVKSKEKIGLAGRNGSGKSTLLKLLSGDGSPDDGTITKPKDYTIGYLPQELHIDSERSVFEEARTALGKIEELEAEQIKISTAIIERDDYSSNSYLNLIDRLDRLNSQLDALGGQNADQKVEEVLKGLGFSQDELHRPISTFSGGWQMRVELAKILLQQPDLMLLDEPTNHLDIESILWLESFLKTYQGSIMMVSHDKLFLDNITNRTIEIINQGIEDYKAPYSKFLLLREERVEKQIQAKKNQDKYRAQLQQNVEKFRAKKNKAKFAQTLIKKLEKMETIEVDTYDNSAMMLNFNEQKRSGKEVIKVKDAGKTYGDNVVLNDLNFSIYRGERIAFVGKNGMGKTTMVKMILDEIDFDGQVDVGYNVDLGYYAQHQNQELQGDITLLETIERSTPPSWQGRERSLLGALLFSGDDVNKKVKVLSGGEKARLALAKLIMEPVNLLVMDEPTNHLDIASKAVLKNALLKFSSTLVIVSHDRDFLTGLTDKVYEFTDGGIKEHIGDVNEFLASRNADSFRSFEQKGKTAKKEKKADSDSKESYLQRKNKEKEERKTRNALARVEKRIGELERKIAKIEEKLQDKEFFSSLADNDTFFTEYEDVKTELESAMAEWEVQAARVEKLTKEDN